MASNSTNMALRLWDLLSDVFNHTELVDNWNKVDVHDHTTGKGVQVPTGGIANSAINASKIADTTITSSKFVADVVQALIPSGTILATGRSTAPTGYLLCNGGTANRTTHATLFTAIGTTYGAGDGSTTFGLPDLRGRVPVGEDGSAARLTANDALGQSGGEEKHTLTTGEMPSHTHRIFQASGAGGVNSTSQIYAPPNGVASVTGLDTQSAGGGGSHNNMQPFQVVNYMIKI